jgi:prepilin peptidase CpaA
MGAGDVKLMAGLGAWLGWEVTFWAFIATVVVGACMAIVMAWRTGQFQHHAFQAVSIVKEIFAVKDPRKLSAIAAERKPRMLLLPYGIPICIGAIGYFLWSGML